MTNTGSDATPLTAPPSTAQEVIQQQTSTQDYVVLRWAVIGLLAAIVISLVGVLVLAYEGIPTPDGIIAIGSAGVGALATMLVRPPLFPVAPTRQPPPPTGDRRAA